MKRLLISLALLAATVMGANEFTGLRLPWRTARVIADAIANDSAYLDTSAFLHNRQSDSAYNIYFSMAIADTANITILKGRGAKVTVNDTLLAYKLYIDAVHAESLAPTTGLLLRKHVADSTWNDTFFFKHARQDDSIYDLYLASVTGDSGRLRYVRGRDGYLTLIDTVIINVAGYIGGVTADSMLVSKYYVDNADTASFKHSQDTDSVANLYAHVIYADSLFLTGLATDSWVMKAGTHVSIAWTADTAVISSDTATVHTWANGIYLPAMGDTARAAATDTATALRGNLSDTADILRAEMDDTAAAYAASHAHDTADALRAVKADSAWVNTNFFRHARESDSAYNLYLSMVIGDTSLWTILKGRSAKLTVHDTLLLSLTSYLGAVNADSALMTKNAARGDMGDTARAAATDTAAVLRAAMPDTAIRVVVDTVTALRGDVGDTARIAAHDTANIVRAEIVDSIGSIVGESANVVRAEIRDTINAVDSLIPDVVEADRYRGGAYYLGGNSALHIDSSTIAADSTILYLWVNTKRYALTLSNP